MDKSRHVILDAPRILHLEIEILALGTMVTLSNELDGQTLVDNLAFESCLRITFDCL